MEKHRDELKGQWCFQGHGGCLGLHSGLLWTHDDLAYRDLESCAVEDEGIQYGYYVGGYWKSIHRFKA